MAFTSRRLRARIVSSNCLSLLLLIAVSFDAVTALGAPDHPMTGAAGTTQASWPVSSKTTEPGDMMVDLATAIRLAEQRAPELLGPEAERIGVAGFRTAADRTFHRPPRIEVSVGPRYIPGSGGSRMGVDTTLGVFQEFSTGHYGAELERYATSVRQRAETHHDAVRRDARVRAYLAWLDALEARELLVVRSRAVEGTREILRIAEARLAAGRSSPGEAALAQSLVGSAEAAVLSAEGSITVAYATLRHVCGIALHRPMQIVGALELPSVSIDEDSLRNHVQDVAPDLVAARAQAVSAEQSAKLGRAHSRPHIELGPTVTREGTGEWAFLGHLRVPLPGVDPAAADNAERQLTAHLARAAVGIAEQAILRDVEIALHEREHAIRVRDLLRLASIAPAERAAREAQLQYEAGRSDLVSVIAARRELYDALEKWTRAAVDVRRAEARLERYTAMELQQKGRLAPGAR
jgi:outer membrane protein, heavy metal efflux system